MSRRSAVAGLELILQRREVSSSLRGFVEPFAKSLVPGSPLPLELLLFMAVAGEKTGRDIAKEELLEREVDLRTIDPSTAGGEKYLQELAEHAFRRRHWSRAYDLYANLYNHHGTRDDLKTEFAIKISNISYHRRFQIKNVEQRDTSGELNSIFQYLTEIAKRQEKLQVIERNPRVITALGHIFYTLKLYDEALDKYKEATKQAEEQKENGQLRNLHQFIGDSYFKLRLWDDSITHFEKTLSANSEAENGEEGIQKLRLRERLGYAYFKKGDSAKALDQFLSVLERPDKANLLAPLREPRKKRAKKNLVQIVSSLDEPNLGSVDIIRSLYKVLATDAILEGNLVNAIGLLEAAYDRKKKDMDTVELLAHTYAERANEISRGGNITAGELTVISGLKEGVKHNRKKATRYYYTKATEVCNYAIDHLLSDRASQLRMHQQQRIELRDRFYLLQGEIRYSQRDILGALQMCRNIGNENNPEVMLLKGKANLQQGKIEEARESFERALAIDGNSVVGVLRGTAALEEVINQGNVHRFVEVAKYQPTLAIRIEGAPAITVDLRNLLGVFYGNLAYKETNRFAMPQLFGLSKQYLQMASQGEQPQVAFYNLGVLYRRNGGVNKPSSYFQKALRHDSKFIPALIQLISVFSDDKYTRDRTQSAVRLARELSQHPELNTKYVLGGFIIGQPDFSNLIFAPSSRHLGLASNASFIKVGDLAKIRTESRNLELLIAENERLTPWLRDNNLLLGEPSYVNIPRLKDHIVVGDQIGVNVLERCVEEEGTVGSPTLYELLRSTNPNKYQWMQRGIRQFARISCTMECNSEKAGFISLPSFYEDRIQDLIIGGILRYHGRLKSVREVLARYHVPLFESSSKGITEVPISQVHRQIRELCIAMDEREKELITRYFELVDPIIENYEVIQTILSAAPLHADNDNNPRNRPIVGTHLESIDHEEHRRLASQLGLSTQLGFLKGVLSPSEEKNLIEQFLLEEEIVHTIYNPALSEEQKIEKIRTCISIIEETDKINSTGGHLSLYSSDPKFYKSTNFIGIIDRRFYDDFFWLFNPLDLHKQLEWHAYKTKFSTHSYGREKEENIREARDHFDRALSSLQTMVNQGVNRRITDFQIQTAQKLYHSLSRLSQYLFG